MKLLRKNETFAKDKELINYTALYLDLGNGVIVKIKPVYKNDFNVLKISACEYEK